MEERDKGAETEDLLEIICTKMFLADLVVRNPKYRKPNTQQKEAADFLVPFGDHLLAFQVRSKVERKSATQKEPKDYDRIRRRLYAALDQFKAVKEALDENNILELRNVRGILLPFDRTLVKVVSGVVVLDLVGEEKFAADDRTEILAGYEVRNNIPIHVFMRDVFEELAKELDTVPDFVAYLDARRALFEKGVLCPTTSELDFLAFYKARPDLVRGCLAGECDILVIEDGLWQQHRKNAASSANAHVILNEPSRIIDDYLNSAHGAIGSEMDCDIADGRNDAEQGTVENYWAIALEFARLNRTSRRAIGEKLLEKMRKADNTGDGYGVVLLPNGTAVVVLASKDDTPRRAKGLFNLCAAAYCGLKPAKVLGLATEPLSATARSYFAICLEGVAFENHDELAERFRQSFKHP